MTGRPCRGRSVAQASLLKTTDADKHTPPLASHVASLKQILAAPLRVVSSEHLPVCTGRMAEDILGHPALPGSGQRWRRRVNGCKGGAKRGRTFLVVYPLFYFSTFLRFYLSVLPVFFLFVREGRPKMSWSSAGRDARGKGVLVGAAHKVDTRRTALFS